MAEDPNDTSQAAEMARLRAQVEADKGILDVDDWTTSLVQKLQAALPAMLTALEGKTLTIEHPALVKPIIVTFHTA